MSADLSTLVAEAFAEATNQPPAQNDVATTLAILARIGVTRLEQLKVVRPAMLEAPLTAVTNVVAQGLLLNKLTPHCVQVLAAGPSTAIPLHSLISNMLLPFSKATATPIHNIPLQERGNQVHAVSSLVHGNLKRSLLPVEQISGNAKTDFNILVFAGGAGIGKTSLAYESAQHLFRTWKTSVPPEFHNAQKLYLMVDFSNGSSLSAHEKVYTADILIGIRLAYAYYAQSKLSINFTEFSQIFRELYSRFSVAEVLAAMRVDLNLAHDSRLVPIIHIDEFQFIFDKEATFTHPENPKGLFKDMMYTLGAHFTNPRATVQLFLSGTTHRKVVAKKEPTMYTFKFIAVPLLSLQGTLKLVTHYATLCGANNQWQLHRPFLQLLADLGGLPRAVSYLVLEHFEPNSREFFQKVTSIPYSPIFNKIADAIQERYGIDGFITENTGAAAQVLRHAIFNMPIRRDFFLSGVLVGEMEDRGHVFLEQNSIGHLVLRMPFLFVYIYNTHLQILPEPLAKCFNLDVEFLWQNWEKFNAYYETFLTNFHRSLRAADITIGDLFWSAYGTHKTRDLRVQLQQIESVVSLENQFPSTLRTINKDTGAEVDWKSGKYLLLNAKSAQFGDTMSFRKAVDHSGKLVLTAGQEKWDYNGEVFNASSANNEHTKVLKAVETNNLLSHLHSTVTVYITSQPIEDPHALQDGVLVIARQNFKEYYGPFADRAALASTAMLNPNFADFQHLKAIPGVGDVTAGKVLAERQKAPFTDMVNFRGRLQLKEFKYPLSFFPFSD